MREQQRQHKGRALACFASVRKARALQVAQVNDRYEFYDTLDLDRGGQYLAPGADRAVRNTYRLLAVLVHSGGVHGGHYYAFVRLFEGAILGGDGVACVW